MTARHYSPRPDQSPVEPIPGTTPEGHYTGKRHTGPSGIARISVRHHGRHIAWADNWHEAHRIAVRDRRRRARARVIDGVFRGMATVYGLGIAILLILLLGMV